MKKHKICKILLVILAIFLCVAFYELLGICVAYKKQPEVSNTTKKETKNGSWNKCSENTERAVIIEKNPEALLQRVRLIKNAKKEIILSTFAFQSDESGKLILGALHDAADRGVHIRLLVDGMESWLDMEGNPYFYGLSSHENVEIKLYNKANPLKPWKMMGRMHDKYLIADGKRYILGGRNTYNYFLGDFPGHKNYDRDVLVVCDEPEKENSVNQLLEYFETIWEQEDSDYFHDNKKLANRKSVKNAVLELQNGYQKYFEENKERICDTDYTDETFETEKIALVSNPIHTGSKEPVVWYQLGELMKNAKNRVKIHTPYIICNDMMYNTWEEIAENVSDFSIMTNSVANNGNPFGAADYAKNRNRILSTGINIWEYEGGYSYHGKSILIDDDLSVIGSFKRIVGNIAGVICFTVLYFLLPSSIYAYIGILGGIGVGFSAQYGWQAVFNTFGALAIAAETYGLQGAVSLRVIQNVFGVVFALAFCVIFYWFMSKKKESEVTVHAE